MEYKEAVKLLLLNKAVTREGLGGFVVLVTYENFPEMEKFIPRQDLPFVEPLPFVLKVTPSGSARYVVDKDDMDATGWCEYPLMEIEL